MHALLLLDKLTKRRGEDVFAPVSFTLAPGQGLGIVGHNGSGKTTLLDMIAGIVRPTTGHIEVRGSIGYAMQHRGFQEQLSIKDNLFIEAYLSGLRGAEAAEQVRLVAARLEMLPYWNKRYAKCSSGMRGRLSVASALLASPQILLLDEVYSFLDEQSTAHAQRALQAEKERGAIIVMVSHQRQDFHGLCEQVLSLPCARIDAGEYAVPESIAR
jgi:ABC-type multidrug transport system ATPase subunit